MSAKNNQPIHKGALVLIDTGKGWLLQHRDNKDGIFWPNRYGLWGGSFEPEDEGDSLKAALRELFEEARLAERDIELKKTRVTLQDDKVLIAEENVPVEMHYYYGKLKSGLAVHTYEGDGVKEFAYDTNFDNNTDFVPYVADAVRYAEDFLNEA